MTALSPAANARQCGVPGCLRLATHTCDSLDAGRICQRSVCDDHAYRQGALPNEHRCPGHRLLRPDGRPPRRWVAERGPRR